MLSGSKTDICRACLTSAGNFYNIFSAGILHTTIAAAIMECAPIKIMTNDELPVSICTDCVNKLKMASQFRAMCIQSDTTLRYQCEQNKLPKKSQLYESGPSTSVTMTCFQDSSLDTVDFSQMPVKVELFTDEVISKSLNSNPNIISLKQENGEEPSLNLSEYTNCDQNKEVVNNVQIDTKGQEMITNETVQCDDPVENAVMEYYRKRSEIQAKKILDKIDKRKEKRVYESKDKVYKCDLCDKRLKSWNSFQVHKRGHTGEKPFECDLCHKKFTQKANVERHKLVLHSGMPKPISTKPAEKKHECVVCGRKFRYNYVLKTHMRIHTGEKQSMCDTCGKKFHHPDNLKKHMMIHTGERNYKCEVCSKDFIWLGNLKKHYRSVHEDYRPHKCDICLKTFQQRWYLRSHMLVHTGERPFQCDVCNKSFAKSYTLTEHKRIHTGEKPYRCDICEKSFTQRGPLRAHEKSHALVYRE